MSKNTLLNKSNLIHILRELISDDITYKDEILEVLLMDCSADHINLVIHLMHAKEFKKIQKGDYVIVPAPEDLVDNKFHWDVLEDMGLLPRKGYLYAEVIKDAGWSSDYRPLFPEKEISLICHDEKKNFTYVEHKAHYIDMEKVDDETQTMLHSRIFCNIVAKKDHGTNK